MFCPESTDGCTHVSHTHLPTLASETTAKPQVVVTFNAVTLFASHQARHGLQHQYRRGKLARVRKVPLPAAYHCRASRVVAAAFCKLAAQLGRTTVSEPPRLTGPAAGPLPRRMDTPTGAEQLLRLVVLPRIQRDKWSLYWKARTHELSPAAFAHSITETPCDSLCVLLELQVTGESLGCGL